MIHQREDLLSLWEDLSRHLIRRHGREFFQNWLSPLRIRGIENRALIIHAPNYLVLSRIHSTYLSEMLEEIGKIPQYSSEIDTIKLRLVEEEKHSNISQNSKYSFENLLGGESNEFAREIAWKIMEGRPSFPFAYFQGEIGCGKTHLMKALENFLVHNSPKQIRYMPTESFVRSFVKASKEKKDFQGGFENIEVLMIDDVERLSNKKGSQEALLQIINSIVSSDGLVIASSHVPPRAIEGMDSRLISHFNSGVLARIEKPDLNLRRKIINKMNQEGGGKIPQEVTQYLPSRLHTSVRELMGACNRLICYQRFSREILTIPATLKLLRDLISKEDASSNSPLLDQMIDMVEEEFSVPRKEILKKRTSNNARKARYALIYIITQKAGLTYAHVKQCFPEGEVMGTQAIRHAIREAHKLSTVEKGFCQKILRLEQKISNSVKENGI